MKYNLSKNIVIALQNVIDVNLKGSGLEILGTANNLLGKLKVEQNDESVVIDFTENELKSIDSFLDGALRQLGLNAVQITVDIINEFKAGVIQEEETQDAE